MGISFAGMDFGVALVEINRHNIDSRGRISVLEGRAQHPENIRDICSNPSPSSEHSFVYGKV